VGVSAAGSGLDRIESILGDDKALLAHQCKTIQKDTLHLPGPDFVDRIFALSDRSREKPVLALIGLALWALVNGGLVVADYSHWPLVSLALGFAGAGAIIVMGTLLARMQWLNFLRYCGEHSIVIYLAFFLPMAVTRTILLKTGVITDIGAISLIVTVAGIAGAVVIWRLAQALRADFLFERPKAFWIAPKKPAPVLQPAE